MNADPRESAPLACVTDAIPAEERPSHVAVTRHLFGVAAQEHQALAEGYAFRFDPDELESLTRFVANERRCCPCLTFEIVVLPDEGPVWLRLSGPAGTRRFLEAELPI